MGPALAELESDPPAGEVIAWLSVGCNAAIVVADVGVLARISQRFHAVAVAAGAWNNVQESLHFRVTPAIIDGALDEAEAVLTELDAIHTAQGLRYAPTGKLSEVLAWRGAEAELRTRAAVICDGDAKGRGLDVTMTESALGVLELSLGNYAAALAAWPADWQHYSGTSTLLVADFAEAAVRGGDEAAARAALERYADGPGADGAPSLPGLLAGLARSSPATTTEPKALPRLDRPARRAPCPRPLGSKPSRLRGVAATEKAATRRTGATAHRLRGVRRHGITALRRTCES